MACYELKGRNASFELEMILVKRFDLVSINSLCKKGKIVKASDFLIDMNWKKEKKKRGAWASYWPIEEWIGKGLGTAL
jgi:hypothetical protein